MTAAEHPAGPDQSGNPHPLLRCRLQRRGERERVTNHADTAGAAQDDDVTVKRVGGDVPDNEAVVMCGGTLVASRAKGKAT